jgi:peptidoglycan/xylan/chitin deacetylase (PgdA/CDA1 family)
VLYSGVSWGATGYEVVVLDDAGGPASPTTRFGVGETDAMIAYLRGLGEPAVTVVDSTNGLLDGRMMAAGLDVYRADPHVLPERPLFGSVAADHLAGTARRDLASLTRLARDRGTQTGREAELEAGIAASAAVVDALTIARRCLSFGDRHRPEVALTFDDGPHPPYTGQILDTLERYGIPATFFCIGLNAGGRTEEVARIREQRHGLGNHTWSHPFLPELSRAQLSEQIARTAETIAEASGGPAPALFRPPYGSRTPQIARWLAEMVSTIVLWDVEPVDWAMPGAEVIARIVLERTRPGSIILLHDGGGDRSQTVASLPAIIDGLLVSGYRFVLVEDLVPAIGAPERRSGAD